MVSFFFYKNLTNVELLERINVNLTINDGFIAIKKYDNNNNILEISDNFENNSTLLHGKIVEFNMSFDEVIEKINLIEECKFNKTKYSIEKVSVNTNNEITKAYIIY